jgi:hypothetical protein
MRLSAPAKRTLAMALIVIWIVFYCGLVVRLGEWLLPVHWIVDLMFYVAAGILWIFPIRRLLRWGNT